ncbi:MAG: Zn-dependent hydrolase, partial [Smithella sp.]|nr:Zn-dependent hydrolase [Smithella sp.]
MKTEEIAEGIYLIGGPNVTRPEDAAVYLVDFGDE